jgi:hypothetical protein
MIMVYGAVQRSLVPLDDKVCGDSIAGSLKMVQLQTIRQAFNCNLYLQNAVPFNMPQKSFYIYIICNELKTVLYTGVTNNLQERIMEHYRFRGQKEKFTSRYNIYYLLYYEAYQ